MKNLTFFILLAVLITGLVRAQTPPPAPNNQPPPPAANPAPPQLPPGTTQIPPNGQAPMPPPPLPDLPPEPLPTPPPMDGGLPMPPVVGGEDDGAPIMQIDPDYNYDPTGRRDPFKPYGTSQNTQMSVTPTNPESPEKPPAPTDPLQMYDISQFRLVGIIWQVKKPKAVVRDPVGKMHLIYRDTKIGRNNGFVASIREGEVLVVEPTIGENGMPSAITRTMALKK